MNLLRPHSLWYLEPFLISWPSFLFLASLFSPSSLKLEWDALLIVPNCYLSWPHLLPNPFGKYLILDKLSTSTSHSKIPSMSWHHFKASLCWVYNYFLSYILSSQVCRLPWVDPHSYLESFLFTSSKLSKYIPCSPQALSLISAAIFTF